MSKVGRSLSNVNARKRSCRKPGCRSGSYKISRHHKGHQFMFVSSFVRTRYGDPRYKDFVEKYYQFRLEDIVDICDHHHMEIHVIYDRIIQRDMIKTGRHLRNYSWVQATTLMKKLEKRCERWLKENTPGISPDRKRFTTGGYQNAVMDLKKQWIQDANKTD